MDSGGEVIPTAKMDIGGAVSSEATAEPRSKYGRCEIAESIRSDERDGFAVLDYERS